MTAALTLFDRIPPPQNYFVGHSALLDSLPNNLLLFTRREFGSSAHLDSQHHRYVLLLSLHGAGDVCLNEKILPLAAGDGLLIFPHQLHHYLNCQGPLRWLFLTFEQPGPTPYLRLRDRPVSLPPRAWQLVERIMELYVGVAADGTPGSPAELVLNAALLLQELLASVPAPGAAPLAPAVPASARTQVIDRVNRYLHARLAQKLTQAEIARHVGVSPSHLRFLIRQGLGLSLGQYLNRVRLNRAVGLLAEERWTVGEVAAACGFASLFAFSRAFKRQTGRSPRAWRQAVGEARGGTPAR